MIAMVLSKSNRSLDGQTVAATVARSRSSGVGVLAPPFCDLPMEGATLEQQVFPTCNSYLSTVPVRRDNWSAAYCAVDDLYLGITRHEIDNATTRSPKMLVDPLMRAHPIFPSSDLLLEPYLFISPRLPDNSSLAFKSFGGLFLLVGLCALAVVSIIAGLWWWCRRARGANESTGQLNQELGRGVAAPRRYHYRVVAEATGNFADSRRIGRGGFGAVYQGFLTDAGGRHVAVKVLSPESVEQGRKEFEAEVRIIGRLRHRSLVELLGWCDCRRGLFLVYQLVPEGSLDRHLHSSDILLNWSQRYTIAVDLGSAILYLHTECEQCVVHGDIKTSNVMLDSSLRAKLGDFGLARLVDHGAEPQTTQVVAGTFGYIDPEFVATRRPSAESDVYSFGVVLLEIATGKRPTPATGQPAGDDAPALLIRRVRDLYNRNSILDAADQRLNGQFDRQQMERVLVTGLWCAHRDRARRPSIAQAMAVLRPEGAGLPDFPAEFLVDLEQIHGLQEQAFGDLSFGSTRSSAATAYHTPADSSYLRTEE